eukprot:scaffold45210_cov63-Phaeocystis_antarctica.AAC.3
MMRSGKPTAKASEPPQSGFFQVFQLKTVLLTLVTSFPNPSSEPKFLSKEASTCSRPSSFTRCGAVSSGAGAAAAAADRAAADGSTIDWVNTKSTDASAAVIISRMEARPLLLHS